MLSSLKQIAVISITTFYVLQLCMLFSGALIENIQQLRHQNQIAKTLLAEQKEISLKEWGKLENKKEIKINETFYDVISFKIVSKKVIILAVKDDFEREIRISIRNLFSKKIFSQPNNKKKILNPYNYFIEIEKEQTFTPNRLFVYLKKPSLLLFCGKPKTFTTPQYRPPC